MAFCNPRVLLLVQTSRLCTEWAETLGLDCFAGEFVGVVVAYKNEKGREGGKVREPRKYRKESRDGVGGVLFTTRWCDHVSLA